ncbi:GNAT family N-acetyltransferase [Psychroserpens sp.]|uniref:GNAT family N-acetyltransferase n=1 Tax=Psychroserpens sp. TaxID=2020870 RepID=UPI001B2C2AD9|nr:GNAT family N-acetyltransferase [Psychroserpens sp.]MBO6605262.1 GNAT family N-acetyltransferase [Psychroserpens sp.]MBO6631325.1 GNAT family N-acetyltransferase [Psychroserpens sp.]MBO6653929.1 GNAT family N-acetyltransferase [Psychroserpens sp.]MBO6682250.1 GNAT family N-acetyltransferase [Psychroserpens sp.]MBO6748636.1 GNAT family N-acetyltransferase [Psychroserpens sp.]
MIRKATLQDIDSIIPITKACGQYMISKGIYQWNDYYPNRAAFENDVDRDELYVIEIDGNVIGCIVISTLKDDEYLDVDWITTSDNSIYVHRLAIHPKYQGNGLAQQLMDFAEDWARTNKFESIRLDTFSKNERNQKFYELRGYQKLSDIYFPKQSEYPFHCYELLL